MKIPPWLLYAVGGAGAGGVAYLLFRNRVGLNMIADQIVQAGRETMFAWSLPDNAQPYAEIILDVAKQKKLDPFLIAAIGQKESRWGDALRPPGPGGTGDWTARNWTTENGVLYAMPPDGQGWGRGLMQLDWWWYRKDFANGLDWADPYENIAKGADRLVDAVKYFSSKPSTPYVTLSATNASRRGVSPGQYPDPRPLSGELLNQAAIAAYNTGNANVLMSVAVGVSPDVTTAGAPYGTHNYGANVIAMASDLAAKFYASI